MKIDIVEKREGLVYNAVGDWNFLNSAGAV